MGASQRCRTQMHQRCGKGPAFGQATLISCPSTPANTIVACPSIEDAGFFLVLTTSLHITSFAAQTRNLPATWRLHGAGALVEQTPGKLRALLSACMPALPNKGSRHEHTSSKKHLQLPQSTVYAQVCSSQCISTEMRRMSLLGSELWR